MTHEIDYIQVVLYGRLEGYKSVKPDRLLVLALDDKPGQFA